MERKLTTKFKTYQQLKWKRKNGKGLVDLIDVQSLDAESLIPLIRLGNPVDDGETISEEAACDILDKYLEDNPDNSCVDAYFDLLEEIDADSRDLKGLGVNVAELRAKVKKDLAEKAVDIADAIQDAVDDTSSDPITLIK